MPILLLSYDLLVRLYTNVLSIKKDMVVDNATVLKYLLAHYSPEQDPQCLKLGLSFVALVVLHKR